MTREEFSTKLKELRDNSNLLVRHLSYKMDTDQSNIYRIEKAQNNYNFSVAMDYINAADGSLYVYDLTAGRGFLIESVEYALNFLRERMQTSTVPKISAHTGISPATLTFIKSGRIALTIDKFIALSEFFNLKIIIQSK